MHTKWNYSVSAQANNDVVMPIQNFQFCTTNFMYKISNCALNLSKWIICTKPNFHLFTSWNWANSKWCVLNCRFHRIFFGRLIQNHAVEFKLVQINCVIVSNTFNRNTIFKCSTRFRLSNAHYFVTINKRHEQLLFFSGRPNH